MFFACLKVRMENFVRMKKILSILLCTALMAACLCGCGAAAKEEKKLSVVVTIFPEYDWVREILGENPGDVQLTLLLDNGVDLHSFQPTAKDILTISNCDVFIYVGGESDAWVKDALSEAANENMIVIDLLDALGDAIKEEEEVEGMEEHEHEHEAEYDEHVWLSLRNASVLCEEIEKALESIDPANQETYRKNLASYQEKLSQLDEKYTQAVASASGRTLLFGDRFPFRYLVDDYGLNYYAAFSGCSAETEASFDTILFLASKTDELSLPAVLRIEGANHRIAETIVENTAEKNQEVLVLDSMQSATSKDVQNGVTYLSIMEKNLEVLKQALQ